MNPFFFGEPMSRDRSNRLRNAGGRLLSVAVLCIVMGLGLDARAGHYRIADVELFEPEVQGALEAQGIVDTEQLLAATLQPDGREALARRIGVPVNQVREFARLTEFLQLEGVGVRIARLMVAAGVSGVEELAGADAVAITARLAEANVGARIAPLNPPVEAVHAWIEHARRAPHRVQD